MSLWRIFGNRQITIFDGKYRRFQIIKVLWRHTKLQINDQLGRKRYQKKRKDMGYKLLKGVFFQKCLGVHELQAVKNCTFKIIKRFGLKIPLCNVSHFLDSPRRTAMRSNIGDAYHIYFVTNRMIMFWQSGWWLLIKRFSCRNNNQVGKNTLRRHYLANFLYYFPSVSVLGLDCGLIWYSA